MRHFIIPSSSNVSTAAKLAEKISERLVKDDNSIIIPLVVEYKGKTHETVVVVEEIDADGMYAKEYDFMFINPNVIKPYLKYHTTCDEKWYQGIYKLTSVILHEMIHVMQVMSGKHYEGMDSYNTCVISDYWTHPIEVEPLFNDIFRDFTLKYESLINYFNVDKKDVFDFYMGINTHLLDTVGSKWRSIIVSWLEPLKMVPFYQENDEKIYKQLCDYINRRQYEG